MSLCSYKDTSHHIYGHSNPALPQLNWLHLQRPYFRLRSCCEILGGRELLGTLSNKALCLCNDYIFSFLSLSHLLSLPGTLVLTASYFVQQCSLLLTQIFLSNLDQHSGWSDPYLPFLPLSVALQPLYVQVHTWALCHLLKEPTLLWGLGPLENLCFPKSWFFEKINKIIRPLANLTKMKIKKKKHKSVKSGMQKGR
jgi:hypothetical protein